MAVESIAKRRRSNLVTIFNNTTILPFKFLSKFICFYCGKQDTSYDTFVKHTMTHEPCDVKHKSLIKQKADFADVKLDVSNITCRICKQSEDSFESIILHLSGHGINYDHDVKMYISMYRVQDLKCLMCEEQFPKLRSLIAHVNSRHVKRKLPCGKCDQNFENAKDFLDHVPICRRLLASLGYTCNICNTSFRNMHTLYRHRTSVHETRKNTHKEKLVQKSIEKSAAKSQERLDEKPKRSNEDRRRAELIRKNVACVLKFTSALPFRHSNDTFTCFYCSKSSKCHEIMRAHCIQDHPFENEEKNLVKIVRGPKVSVKVDITLLHCKLCLERFDDLDVIINHLIDVHEIGYDRSMVGCLEAFTVVYEEGIADAGCSLSKL